MARSTRPGVCVRFGSLLRLALLGWVGLLSAPPVSAQFEQVWLAQFGDLDKESASVYVVDQAVAAEGQLWVAAVLARMHPEVPWIERYSLLLLRFGPDGLLEWRLEVPDTSTMFSLQGALALDAEGCAYFAYRRDAVGMLCKYSPSGVELWRRRLDLKWWNVARVPMAVDAQSGLIVAGSTPGQHPKAIDLLLSRYGPDGQLDWQTTHAGPDRGFDNPQHLAIDGQGRLHLTAYSASGFATEPGNSLISWAFEGDGSLIWTSAFQMHPSDILELEATEVLPDGSRTHALAVVRLLGTQGSQQSLVLHRTGPSGETLWTRVEPVGPNQVRWCDALSSAPWGDVVATGYTAKKVGYTWWVKALAESYSTSGELTWTRGSAAQCTGTQFLGPARFDAHGRVLLLARACSPTEFTLESFSPLGEPLAVSYLDIPRIESTTLATLLVDPTGDLRLVGSASLAYLSEVTGIFAGRYTLH